MESGLEPSLDSVAHGTRNDDPSRWCLRLKSRGHVYIVTVDVIAFNDDIADVKANPKHDGLVPGLVAICLNHGLLELNCSPERIHGASKLGQAAVASQPDHAPAAACGSWRKSLVQMFQKPRDGAALIPAHQPRRSNYIGKENCRQFALLTDHGNFLPFLQRIVGGPGLLGN